MAHRDHVIKVLLHGLTGPVDGKSYTEVMIPMGSNDDQWIADAATYVRANFGNSAPAVTPADVARVRAATATRKTSWTLAELSARCRRCSDAGRDVEGLGQPPRRRSRLAPSGSPWRRPRPGHGPGGESAVEHRAFRRRRHVWCRSSCRL